MAKTNQIKKLVNGEIADADDVNQIVENAGAEGGSIPYSEVNQQRSTLGDEALGSANYPWGDIFVNKDAYLRELITTSASISASVKFENLRKFIYLKDAPASYSGQANKFVGVNSGETALEFKTSPSKSNLLFEYVGHHETQGTSRGEYTGTSFIPNGQVGNYRFLQVDGTSYITIARWKWTKIPGVTTVKIHCFIWSRAGNDIANLRVSIGSATNNASGTIATHTPEYITFTVDVSALVDGTVYDVTADLKGTDGTETYCSYISGQGS